VVNNDNTEAFFKIINDLDIVLSRSSDGVYTVCTTSEPLFCYDGDSPEALQPLVIDTLVSYGKHFFGIEPSGGHTESEPLNGGPFAIERSTPHSRLKPIFDLAA